LVQALVGPPRLARGGGAPAAARAEQPEVRIVAIDLPAAKSRDADGFLTVGEIQDDEPAEEALVDGAERLLSRRAVRDAFSQ
jgi:hypothetical protein